MTSRERAGRLHRSSPSRLVRRKGGRKEQGGRKNTKKEEEKEEEEEEEEEEKEEKKNTAKQTKTKVIDNTQCESRQAKLQCEEAGLLPSSRVAVVFFAESFCMLASTHPSACRWGTCIGSS